MLVWVFAAFAADLDPATALGVFGCFAAAFLFCLLACAFQALYVSRGGDSNLSPWGFSKAVSFFAIANLTVALLLFR